MWEQIRDDTTDLICGHYRRCVDLAREITFDDENRQHLLVLCLYSAVVELFGPLVTLVRGKQFIGVPQLLRSIYEAEIDLANAIENTDYFESMYAGYLASMIGTLQGAHNTESAGFVAAAGSVDAIRDVLRNMRRQLDELKANGHKPLQIGERFRRAQRQGEYLSAYAHLCSHVHNDIKSLEDRHLRENDDGAVELVLFQESNPRFNVHLTDLAGTVLLAASKRIHMYFESGYEHEIERMEKQLSSERERWPADDEES